MTVMTEDMINPGFVSTVKNEPLTLRFAGKVQDRDVRSGEDELGSALLRVNLEDARLAVEPLSIKVPGGGIQIVSFVTSSFHVPIQRVLTEEAPADEIEACKAAWTKSAEDDEPATQEQDGAGIEAG